MFNLMIYDKSLLEKYETHDLTDRYWESHIKAFKWNENIQEYESL